MKPTVKLDVCEAAMQVSIMAGFLLTSRSTRGQRSLQTNKKDPWKRFKKTNCFVSLYNIDKTHYDTQQARHLVARHEQQFQISGA